MRRIAAISALVLPAFLLSSPADATLSRATVLDYQLPTAQSWMLDKEKVFSDLKAPGTFPVDVLPITTSRGAPDVTTANSEVILKRVSDAFELLSNSSIKLQLRSVLPVREATGSMRGPTDVQLLLGQDFTGRYSDAVLIGVMVPDPSLSFAGIATLTGSTMLINTTWSTSNRTPAKTIAHEFGHNLGLGHSGYAACSGATLNTCEIEEYGDYSDFMGSFMLGYVTDPPHLRLSAWHLKRLGLLADDSVKIIGKSGTFDLAPVYGVGGTKLLIIPVYNSEGYAIEYRPAIGPDAKLTQTQLDIPGSRSYYNNNPSHGVQVRVLRRTSDVTQSLLPTSQYGPEVSILGRPSAPIQGLQAGESLSLPDGSTVRVVAADPNRRATVEVTIPADTTPPSLDSARLSWMFDNQSTITVFAKDWPEIIFDFDVSGAVDDRLLDLAILEVNGVEVARKQRPGKGFLTLKYTPETYGSFKVRGIVRDLAGNETVKETTLLSKAHQYPKSKVLLRAGKPAKSVVEIWYPRWEGWTFTIKPSAGRLGSLRYSSGWNVRSITGLKPGQLVTVEVIGADEYGDTDGGQTLTRKTSLK